MAWAYLAVSIVGALATMIALRPPKSGRPADLSFPPSWLVSELPLHHGVWQVGATAVFGAFGAFGSWPGYLGLAISIASWAALCFIAAEATRAPSVYEAALAAGLGGEHRPVEDARPGARFLRLAQPFPVKPRDVERIREIDYWGDGEHLHALDVYRPRGTTAADRLPVLFYIHGGAWMIGDKREQGLPMMHHLASHGFVCVTANYRLSPKATWPDHVVDCKRALAFLHERVSDFGGDPARIAVSGGSAGGHLAALVGLTPGDPRFQPGFEDADTTVAACVPIYGVYDFCDRDHEAARGLMPLLQRRVMKKRLAEDKEAFEQASPIDRISPSAPPWFSIHGRNDVVVPVPTARSFVGALRAVSTSPVVYAELPRAQHAFEIFWSPRTEATAYAVEDFLASVLVAPLIPPSGEVSPTIR